MPKIQDDILSYREMCDQENVQTLQRGMNNLFVACVHDGAVYNAVCVI